MRTASTAPLRRGLGIACALAMGAGLAIAQEPARNAEGGKPGAAAAKRPSIYDKEADARDRLAKAVERARRDETRVLLMFGGDWCGWCHKLHNLFRTNPEVRKIVSEEYVLATIDLESPNAEPLLRRCKEALAKDELQKGVGYPFLAVLDADGKVLTAQRTDPLEEGDHHDPKKVAAFLGRWKVPAKDAKAVVDEALARASSDDRKVLLTFGAPWCGWCHRLQDWLARPEIAAILGRDFLVARVDVDRMTGGQAMLKHYRPTSSGGIPWFAILDARGQSLATSDGPGGNIGYPGEPEGIEHFLSMVKGQARHIDARQLGALRKSLEEAAERIKKERGH